MIFEDNSVYVGVSEDIFVYGLGLRIEFNKGYLGELEG